MTVIVSKKRLKKLVRRTKAAALDMTELAKSGVELVGRRAEDAAGRVRLERAVRDLQEEIALQMETVGELVYAAHRDGSSAGEDVQEILEYVDSLYEELDGYQRELKRQRGVLLCGACGAENDSGNMYCHNCGRPLGGE